MRLHEIDYASAIPKLVLSQEEITQAHQVGTVDGQPVYVINDGAHVIAFLKNQNKMTSYVAITSQERDGYHNLVRMANTSAPKGSITALVVFLYAKFDAKFRIPAHEPITWDGFKWIKNILKSPRGFHIHDEMGEPIDPAQLQAEWDSARMMDTPGPTQILISKITYNNKIFETWNGMLQPAYRYIHDSHGV
jgi:hypothetical protein